MNDFPGAPRLADEPFVIDVPRAWDATIARLCASPWRRLVVLGHRDQGKSTFCRLLIERLAATGQPAWLLDADLGQKMIGPPACVSLAEAGEAGALDLRRIRFVGETNPSAAMAAVVASVARLASEDAGRLVVNTSGLIAGPGLALKRWTLDALAPEFIVSLGMSEPLAAVLRAQPPAALIRLSPSPAARRKSDREREAARLAAFRTALRGATRGPIGGRVLEDLHRSPPLPAGPRLCGVSDRDGEDLALGICDPQQDWLIAAVELDRVHRLRLGMAAPAELLATAPP
jgi:polynucleotide 5'-hydroxyl-kinase GRC3/NOL9